MRYLVQVGLLLLPTVSSLFFGGGDCGCNSCCAPQPAPCCPAPAPCAPAPSCGCSSGGDYSAPTPICPPKYIILNSASSGAVSVGGSSYSAPVAPIAPASYSTGVAPAPSTAYSEGTQASQQIAAPSPPADNDYTEAAGAAVSPSSSSSVATSTVATSTDHPTYNTNARGYGSKTFNNTKRCPNVELLHFMDDAIIEDDISESKRQVSKSLNAVFTSEDGKPIDVFCAGSRISYRLKADISCEHTKGTVTCVAYKQAS